jgi:hypothetical protein
VQLAHAKLPAKRVLDDLSTEGLDDDLVAKADADDL